MIKIKDTTAGPETTAEITLTPAEVAALYRVDTKTIARWVKAGRLPQNAWFWTPGGHRRYHGNVILALINGTSNAAGNGDGK